MRKLIFILFLILSYNVQAQLKSTLRHYSLDNVLDDSSGNGATLKAYGTASFSTDMAVGSHSGLFDGADDRYRIPITNLGSTFFVSWWADSDVSITEESVIICMADAADYWYTMFWTDGTWRNKTPTSNSGNVTVATPTSWHHYVVAIDKTDGGKSRFYLDGVRATHADSTLNTTFNTNDSIFIGTDFYKNVGWDGRIDEVRIYTGYMPTSAQVDSLFHKNYIGAAGCPGMDGGVIADNQSIVSGSDVAGFTSTTSATGGTGSITYQWKYSTTTSDPLTGSWTNTGTNSTTYDHGTLTETTYFVRYASAATCGSGYSNVLTVTISSPSVTSVIGAYDSTYVLTISQEAWIPEGVTNSDYVGYWLKNRTWRSGNTITYEEYSDPLGAFTITKINNDSARVTISDYTKISGKRISTYDTLVNYLVKTTDAGIGYEIDTFRIYISEASLDHYIDYAYAGTESSGGQTRSQPRNDLDDLGTLTIGHKYWFKRGQIPIVGESTSLQSLLSISTRKMVFGAYDQGSQPKFNGNALSVDCFYVGIDYKSNKCSNIVWNNLHIRNYSYSAMHMNSPSDYMYIHGCIFNNNYRSDYPESHICFNTEDDGDSLTIMPIKIQNCSFDTSSFDQTAEPGTGWEKSYLKVGAGPMYLYNNYFGPITNPSLGGLTIRHMTAHHSVIKHNIFNGSDTRSASWACQIQLRANETIIEDNILYSASNGINIIANTNPTTGGYAATPEYLEIRNNLFRGILVNAINFIPIDVNYLASNDNIIEKNLFHSYNTAIFLKKSERNIIRWNIFKAGSAYGITASATSGYNSNNVSIYGNVMWDHTTDEIRFLTGSGLTVYNNTIDGTVYLVGASSPIFRNNFYKTVSMTGTSDHNIDIDAITPTDYFNDYSGNDYRLKSTASTAISYGLDVGLTYDIAGYLIPQGSGVDIGAYEYIISSPPSSPTPILIPPGRRVVIINF